MNSFIAWIGGKKLLRKEIVKRFPEEGFTRYVEVFGGAGWVLFEKEQGKELEVFNDRDSNLINLYRCIKYHCGELQRELESQGLTDIQRAARFFHIIKVSFGSDRRTFGTNKKNLANAIEYLPLIQKRLQGVVIENKDFENLIRVYDRPEALFYLDPPYHGTEKYYEGSFTEADHERLKAVLSSIKGRFILSYNDDTYVRELYKGYNIEEISRNNSLAGKTKTSQFKELIIRNYEK